MNEYQKKRKLRSEAEVASTSRYPRVVSRSDQFVFQSIFQEIYIPKKEKYYWTLFDNDIKITCKANQQGFFEKYADLLRNDTDGECAMSFVRVMPDVAAIEVVNCLLVSYLS